MRRETGKPVKTLHKELSMKPPARNLLQAVRIPAGGKRMFLKSRGQKAVSYTHLTLPTTA